MNVFSGQIPEEGGGANGDSDLVSDLEFPITINLYISEYPPRYVVNDRLRTVFGMENRAYSLREVRVVRLCLSSLFKSS